MPPTSSQSGPPTPSLDARRSLRSETDPMFACQPFGAPPELTSFRPVMRMKLEASEPSQTVANDVRAPVSRNEPHRNDGRSIVPRTRASMGRVTFRKLVSGARSRARDVALAERENRGVSAQMQSFWHNLTP